MNTLEQPTIEPGFPVEIGRIDKELGKLWEETGDTKTRASLINLAIYTENAGSLAENTDLISKIASQYACRALLIFANASAAQSEARAWINAHCHLAGKGERQICSEQITFQLDGDMVAALPNIVFSHLDSDLPLYFWWQEDFREPLDKKLWGWVDRLIYDSAKWKAPAEQFGLVRKIRTLTEVRTILCDLNWTRLVGARFALAQLFDHSCALARVGKIESVAISSASHTTGLLLLGWLAAQLGWKLEPEQRILPLERGDPHRFRDPDRSRSCPEPMRVRMRRCDLGNLARRTLGVLPGAYWLRGGIRCGDAGPRRKRRPRRHSGHGTESRRKPPSLQKSAGRDRSARWLKAGVISRPLALKLGND